MSITIEVEGVSTVKSNLDTIRRFASGGRTTYVVGTNVHYAPYQEFGTSRMSPNPFMRPAADEVRGNMASYINGASTLGDAIRLAALDLERKAKQKAPVDTGNLRNSITSEKQ